MSKVYALSALLLLSGGLCPKPASATEEGTEELIAKNDLNSDDDQTQRSSQVRSHRRSKRWEKEPSNGWLYSAPLLPEEGDFAIGLNAVPFLAYLGNAFNNSTYNAPSTQFTLGDRTLYGKYFLAPDTAIRARARIEMYTDVDKAAVTDDGQDLEDFDSSETVTDERYFRNANVDLRAGLEKRRGHKRLQGFYGVEANLGVRRHSSLYTYGNEFDSDNPNPTTSTFTGGSYSATGRVLESRPGGTLTLGGRGFAGAELFIAPRVSLGGEFGYALTYALTGSGKTIVESYDAVDEDTIQQTFDEPGGASFDMDTDNLDGSIFLLVHF